MSDYAYIIIPLILLKISIISCYYCWRCKQIKTRQIPVTVQVPVNGHQVQVQGVAVVRDTTDPTYGLPYLIRNNQYDYQQFQNPQAGPQLPAGSYPVQKPPEVHQYPGSQQYSEYPSEPPPAYYAPAQPLPRSVPNENQTLESKQ